MYAVSHHQRFHSRTQEFGKIVEDPAQTVRNEYYKSAFSVAEENAKAHGPLQGTLFWHWYDAGIGPGQVSIPRLRL